MKKRPTSDRRTRCSPYGPLFFLPALFLLQFQSAHVEAQCNNNTVLSITGSTINGETGNWTAPSSGGPFSVRITATGAGGGDVDGWGSPNQGGSGATMSATFIVQNGETLLAIAGGPGQDATIGSGGGGGSGVVNCGTGSCLSGTILIIAAAGNGDNGPGGIGLGGSSDTDGNGEGGASSPGDDVGGGGGGLNSSGENAGGFGGGSGGAQVSKLGIAASGQGSTSGGGDGGAGMGAGGGGGNEGSGGGGGHTGGDGQNSVSAKSYVDASGTDIDPVSGVAGGGANFGTVSIVCLGALPVELVNFKAIIQNDDEVLLLWSTASEKDNLGYDIERSADNRNWSSLGFMPGSGTSTDRHEYSFRDEKPLAGVNYYRLKQTDIDGTFQFTPIVVADIRGSSQFDIFPNPSNGGAMNLRAVSTREGAALLEVYSWNGLKVYNETFRLHEGTVVSPLDMTIFPKGTYTARLEMPDGTIQYKKILLQ